MKVVWSAEAREDRAKIALYIAQFDKDAALRMVEVFEQSSNRLKQFPFLGKRGIVEGTLELVVHKHYFLVYEVRGNTVIILNVLHTSQQYPPIC